MPIPHGEISFKPRTLLRVNGSIIETNQVTPPELHDFIIASTDTITAYVALLHQQDIARAHKPELKQKSIIHVARLALHEWDKTVFDPFYTQSVETVTTDPSLLRREAREYWDAVDATSFQPEIHIRGVKALEGTSGVWMSLRSPN